MGGSINGTQNWDNETSVTFCMKISEIESIIINLPFRGSLIPLHPEFELYNYDSIIGKQNRIWPLLPSRNLIL